MNDRRIPTWLNALAALFLIGVAFHGWHLRVASQNMRYAMEAGSSMAATIEELRYTRFVIEMALLDRLEELRQMRLSVPADFRPALDVQIEAIEQRLLAIRTVARVNMRKDQ